MKTIIRPGRSIYENRLKYGRFRCQACGCEFTADAGDIEYTDLYGCGDVVERDPFSHCPNCGKAALFKNGEWEKVRRTESGYVHLTAEMIEEANKENQQRIDGQAKKMMDDANEIYLMLQGWRPCAYHGGRFLHRCEWESDRWYEFMTRDGTVFKARMKEDTHMDCFYPKAEKKENEVYFYRECR